MKVYALVTPKIHGETLIGVTKHSGVYCVRAFSTYELARVYLESHSNLSKFIILPVEHPNPPESLFDKEPVQIYICVNQEIAQNSSLSCGWPDR